MPPVIQGETPLTDVFVGNVDYDYDYPRGLDLHPKSKLHKKLVEMLWERAWASRQHMQKYYNGWREMDRVLKAYVEVEPNALRRTKKSQKDQEDDDLATVVMPVTFANMETLLTYMTTAFLQDPIFPYEGQGPEDVYGAYLMTQVVGQHAHRSRVGLNLHTQWRDAFAYGIGVATPVWNVKRGKVPVLEESGFMDAVRNLFMITDRRPRFKKGVLWEGNGVRNVDVYRYFPDPQAPANAPQDAEFQSWLEESNYMKLLGSEMDGDEDLFNVRYLRGLDMKSKMGEIGDENRAATSGQRSNVKANQPIDILRMYVNLIPEEWDLGKGKKPEKWVFLLAGDKIIIGAQPMDLNHDLFPVVVAAPDYDGYSSVPVSRLMMTLDIQHIVDFLHGSHIANVRKALNDMIVVDPSLVNTYDLDDPRPGKLIRLRRTAWGRGGIDAAIKQLEVTDVTRNHIADANALANFAQNIIGSPDNLQGQIAMKGERVSATESRDARLSGLSRLERLARIISMQSMQDLAYMFAFHTQQFMSQDAYVKVAGEWPERLAAEYGLDVESGRVRVEPADLFVATDLKELDGTIPGAESPDTWIALLQIAAQSPEIMQTLEIGRVFAHIARQNGAKNPENFIKRAAPAPQVMPDEEVLRQEEAGNLVPLDVGGDGAPSFTV